MAKKSGTPASDESKRWLPLEGAINFRDLGGYEAADGRTVKWGVVFRSGTLARLTDRDHERLTRLGLRLVFDLRTLDEQQRQPSRLPADGDHEALSLPIWPKADSDLEVLLRGGRIWERVDATDISADHMQRIMCKFYRSYALDHVAEYGTLLQRLAKLGDRSAIIHCAAGKDRTGFGAALLLRLLGVSMEQIVDDFQLTNRLVPVWVEQNHGGDVPPHIDAILWSNPDFILSAFSAIDDRYGSFDTYLSNALALSDREREALRTNLLE